MLRRLWSGVRPGEDGLRLDTAPPTQLGPVRLAARARGGDRAPGWYGSALLRLGGAKALDASPLAVTCRGGAHVLRPGASYVVRFDGGAGAGRERPAPSRGDAAAGPAQ